MRKWGIGIGGGLALLLAVIVAVGAISFERWRSEAIAGRESDPGRKIAMTPLGPVEYAVIGEGLPLLVVHGTPGGYDQGIAVEREVPERARPGIMTISPSRPGYLGTPLSSGRSFAQQADLLAALLDQLHIGKAVVMGASGGGLVALQFALRHPDRTRGLLLYAPEVKSAPAGTPDPRQSPALPVWRMTSLEIGMWLVGGPFASSVVKDYDAGDPIETKSWAAMMRTTVPWSAHVAGQRNDVIQWLDPAIDDWPLEDVEAPTLILHGDADKNTSFENAREAAREIPHAEFVTFRGGDHFVMISRWREVSAAVEGFLARFAPTPGQPSEA